MLGVFDVRGEGFDDGLEVGVDVGDSEFKGVGKGELRWVHGTG